MINIKQNSIENILSTKKTFSKNRLSRTVLSALLILGSGVLQAADLYWACSNGEEWDSYPNASTNPCWAVGASSFTGSVSSPSSGDNVSIGSLTGGNTVRYFNLSNTTVYNSFSIGNDNKLLQDRALTFSTINETIGYLSTGYVDVSKGSHKVSDTLTLGKYVIPGLYGPTDIGKGFLTVTNSGKVDARIMVIGDSGIGTLNVSNGGDVISNDVILGNKSFGSGTVKVDGADSRLSIWSILLYPGLGGSGGYIIGNKRFGDMEITNGGYVSDAYAVLGREVGSYGSVLVDGAGSLWFNKNYLTIGDSGLGSLTISNGGNVVSDKGTIGRGTVTVDGVGSRWDSFNLEVGVSGSGTLTISNAGVVASDTSHIGYSSSDSGTVNISGNNSEWINSDSLFIGSLGEGNMNITSGGAVSDVTGTVGRINGSSGKVTVNGAGSSWRNSDRLYVGDYGSGSMNIEAGATVSSTYAAIGNWGGSNGAVNITGAGSNWNNSRNISVGYNGTGTLNINDGGKVSDTNAYVGRSASGVGAVTVNGQNAIWQNNGAIYIGQSGNGFLAVENGGTVNNTSSFVGRNAGAYGNIVVTGNGSSWNNTGGLYIGGNWLVEGGSGRLTVNNKGTVNVGDTLQIWGNSRVDLNDGTINTQTIAGTGQFNFNAGNLNISSDLLLDANETLNMLNLSAVKKLSVGGTTTLSANDILTLDGGTFSTGSFINDGSFDFKRGTFNLTNSDFIVNSTGILGNLVQLNQGQVMNVNKNTAVFSGSVLSLNNAQFSADTVFNGGAINIEGSTAQFIANNTINNGEISFNGAFATLGGGTLSNNGLISGQGKINSNLSNNANGEIALYRGDTLGFTGTGNTNSGKINLYGGAARFDNDLTNTATGVINGRGTLVANGGLTNEGAMRFSGGNADIVGNVTNNGSITVTGNSTATFYDDVVHNGSEILVREGSAAVYFGDVSGAGAFTGTGLNFFEGTLSVGNSPTLSTFEGDFGLGNASLTYIELGGILRGTEYDAIDVAGTASLAGELQVDWYDLGLGDGLFNASIGDSFDIFYAGTILGEFDLLTLAVLDSTMQWDLQYILDDFGMDIVRLNVNAVSAVPVPASVWLFGSGLIGLAGIARRRKIAA